ncbi:LapA family protein, partial [Staphylococcus aureus]|nr:LapA family protein [Staphylococcus aureus]
MSIFKENMITIIAVIIAIIIGMVLQFQFQLPPMVSAVVAILLG